MSKPQSIQVFLPDGEARGIRVAEITTRIVNVVCIPRNKLNEAKSRKEVSRVGIYFLFGDDAGISKPVAYIGEAEDVYRRLKDHNSNKDFWNTAVVVTSKDANLNKACAKYLEWYCYKKANEINRFKIENNNEPTKCAISESDEAYALDFYDNMDILLALLGYPIFESLKKKKHAEIFYCKGKKALAMGEYTDEGFLVLAKSKANIEETKSIATGIVKKRKMLIDDGIMKKDGDIYIFTEDFLFTSPSTASDVVLASSSNGWTAWKTKEGKTLDSAKRL